MATNEPNERDQPTRRPSLMRLLAAALAGGIGVFGVAAGGHSPASAAPAIGTPPPVVTSDATPD